MAIKFPCKECGNPAPLYAKDGANGKAGTIRGSEFLRQKDPEHLFCSLNCAALFGIKAARGQSS